MFLEQARALKAKADLFYMYDSIVTTVSGLSATILICYIYATYNHINYHFIILQLYALIDAAWLVIIIILVTIITTTKYIQSVVRKQKEYWSSTVQDLAVSCTIEI